MVERLFHYLLIEKLVVDNLILMDFEEVGLAILVHIVVDKIKVIFEINNYLFKKTKILIQK